jgi:glycerol-1-phosphate dehydrogenase [NAD(P)+]
MVVDVDLTEGPLIRAILDGTWMASGTGKPIISPIRSIRIAPSLDGGEADLVASLGLGPHIAVVADGNTWSALGRRVARALRSIAAVDSVVLRTPHADEETLANLTGRLRHAEGFVAVGTGTVNDLCKAVSANTGRPYAVFGTAASMNGYTTGTVSLLNRDGVKTTRGAVMPKGVYLDLEVLRQAPIRLTRAGLGDSICRTTAQFDWLLSHLLRNTVYTEVPYRLQEANEQEMFDRAGGLEAGDLAAYAALARVLILMGIGTILTGTTQYGSGSEHLISHAIDMLAGEAHPSSLHGEQTGIATLSMARLQTEILASGTPPCALPARLDANALHTRFGAAGLACAAMFKTKIMGEAALRAFNRRLETSWPQIAARLSEGMRPVPELEAVMAAAGAPQTAKDLALDPAIYRKAVQHAREIRDRYSVLDLAGDAGLIEEFSATQT